MSTLDPNRQYVIGTAGHIDHGKTALVKALTGIDTDRLPEEKARGITIDLGFAHLSDNITIIDVPGHERLIKNMVAGVSTIDMVLFVIAADDGVMPQSREHLDIINLLQIRQGIFVISKCDLADPEWLLLVEDDIRNLLADSAFADAPILQTAATIGEGISELKTSLMETLAAIPPRQDNEVFRQPIDRVFSAKGFGTVITGTVLSGALKDGEEVEIQPPGLTARVRGIQSHNSDIGKARTGFRAAVNLAGVEMEQVQRGQVLVKPGLYQPVEIINARLTVLKKSPVPLKNNQRIRLHIHTIERFARIILPEGGVLKPGESGYVQLRLEAPLHAGFQDRFIIRQYSPQRTIAGGVVLVSNPPRFRKKFLANFMERLAMLESEEPGQRVLGAFDEREIAPLKLWDLKIASNFALDELQNIVRDLESQDQVVADKIGGKTWYFSRGQLAVIWKRLEKTLIKYHEKFPGRAGLSEAEVVSSLEKIFPAEAIRKTLTVYLKKKALAAERQSYRLASFSPALSAKDSEHYQTIVDWYQRSGYCPPTVKEVLSELDIPMKEFKELTRLLREEGKLIFVDETLFFDKTVFERLTDELQAFFQKKAEISVPEFKELTGTTRKHSIPLLTYLDRLNITERDGDVRRAGSVLR